MARPQEFDTQQVLEEVLLEFWTHGYERTTLQDIMQATGLNKSSLYSQYENKHALFLAAFDRYRKEYRESLQRVMQGAGARDAIETFFRDMLPNTEGTDRQAGCMSINVAVEMAPHDPEVRERVDSDFRFVEEQLKQTIERGQSEGDINPGLNARSTARMLVVAFAGIQVLTRSQCGKESLDEALSAFLQVLD
ncbi:MAG: TetR/AcrR family transcriptional regulator [Desulfovibrio sp.]|uniref:TetR/AcrR family transcriptional regulator n=1 Tax=Desulfovibrio sp. 7SRBS1 TaxID=3378064 RepID=UPI003B3F764F